MQTHDERLTEITQQLKALQQERRNLLRESAHMIVDNYIFTIQGNQPLSLLDLFGNHRDLIVVHNMGSSCVYCTLWADGFNGMLPALTNRTAFVLASPDTPDEQQRFAKSRGWHFTMVSTHNTSFTHDMGFTTEHNGTLYTMPGFSSFYRHDDGSIERVSKDYFGPGDEYCALWAMFSALKEGPNYWTPDYSYPS